MDSRKNITFNSYDHRNLPLQMTKGSEVYNYRYDDNGNRIYKDADEEKEYYLRDHIGRELAIYDLSDDKVKMFNIFGNGLVGRFIPGADITLLLTNRILSGNYEAVNTITVDTNVTVTGTANFKAGSSITLKPGFHAVQGCSLTAKIDTVSDEAEKVYYIKDHLGSVRVSVGATGDVTAAQDYYAYGEILRGYAAGGGNNEKYKFTEKERDTESGYDYSINRYYDSELGIWTTTDPLYYKYPAWSPYNYCANNPIIFIDPDGSAFISAEYANEDEMLKAQEKEEKEKREKQQEQERRKKNNQQQNTIANVGIIAGAFGISVNTFNAIINLGIKYGETAKDIADLSKIGVAGEKLGRITGLTTWGISVGQALDNPSTENILEVGANTGLLGIKNPYILGAIGIMDIIGVSDSFYKQAGSLINTFNTSNLNRLNIYLRSGGMQTGN